MSERPWLPVLAAASYAVHLAVVHAMPGLARYQPLDLPAIASGAMTLWFGQAIAGAVASSRPAATALLRALHLVVFWLLGAYLYASHVPLEVGLLAANVEWPLPAGAFQVLRAGLSLPTVAIAVGLVALAAWHDARRTAPAPTRAWRAAALAVVWAAVVVAPVSTYDETTRVVRSALDHQRGTSSLCAAVPVTVTAAAADAGRQPPFSRTPSIVLVVIESLHAAFLDRRDPAGRPILPVLDGLAARGLTVDRFYAHSVQTAKGHFSLLTSIAPAIAGVEFERFPALPVTTLPAVLKQAGYRTLFVQGQADAAFDNTRRFLESHGVDRHVVAAALLTADERERLASAWGASDAGTYLAAERLWDQEAAAMPARPVLLAVATVESHQPFSAPTGPDAPFPTPRTLFERYANAMRTADAALGQFLERLERSGRLRDALVVVTGDHAFPLGAHGLEHNEAGAYDEFFRVPFVLLDPTALPRRVSGPYGQIDVAPTVLARLGGVAPATFQGVVIERDGPVPSRGLPLVQPYAGTLVGAVGERFKYLRHLRTGQEHLVDLEIDPDEHLDLATATDAGAMAARLSLSPVADWLIANHCAMERGAVMPSRP